MTGTSLVFIVMPIIAPICLAVLIALPFLAARNPIRGIASGVPQEPKAPPLPGTAVPGAPRTAPQRPPGDQASPATTRKRSRTPEREPVSRSQARSR
jgi:hypothetical protein